MDAPGRDAWREIAREAVRFVPDALLLLRGVLADPRVPRRAKVEAGLALGYLLVPIDLVPDAIPGLGQLDDVAIVAWALRRLLTGAGEQVVAEHWRGSERALDLLLQLARTGMRPRRLVRLLATRGDRA